VCGIGLGNIAAAIDRGKSGAKNTNDLKMLPAIMATSRHYGRKNVYLGVKKGAAEMAPEEEKKVIEQE